MQETKPEKVAIEPRRQAAITVNSVLNMNKGQISSLFQSANNSTSKSSGSRKKKQASEPVRQAKKPYHMPILVDLEHDSGFPESVTGKLSSAYTQHVNPLDLRCKPANFEICI